MTDFTNQYEEPRNESVGEAQQKLASWAIALLRLFGVKFYPFEAEALAKAFGPIVRRWPVLKRRIKIGGKP